jgi:hypothetical protein
MINNNSKEVKNNPSAQKTDETEYLFEYNNLITLAAIELGNNLAAVASPTLSKQEAVTQLYENCINPKSWLSQKCSTLKYLLLFPFILSWHGYNLVSTSRAYRVLSLPKGCVYIRSWLVPRSFILSSIRDDYFRNLLDDLKMHENVIVALQPVGIGLKLIRKLRKNRLPDNYIVPIGLLTVTDILKCLFEYVFHGRAFLLGTYNLRGRDIRSQINFSLLHDYLKMQSFLAFQEKYIADKLVSAGIKAFIYVFENQSWEKSYCRAFEGTNIPLIGYQSSGVSKSFLNFFPCKLDQQRQLQPNFLLTVGDGFSRYLSENACYKSQIITFAALRIDHLATQRRYSVKAPSPVLHRRILYAFSVHQSQYKKIIDTLTQLFRDSSIEVHLKLHPLHANRKMFNKNKLPSNFLVVEEVDNHTLSATYDFVIFNDNSYGIESLIYGVKCFEFDLFEQGLDERLIYFDAWRYRIDAMEIRDLRDSIETGDIDKMFNPIAISDYINYLYSPYVGDLSVILFAVNSQSEAPPIDSLPRVTYN